MRFSFCIAAISNGNERMHYALNIIAATTFHMNVNIVKSEKKIEQNDDLVCLEISTRPAN